MRPDSRRRSDNFDEFCGRVFTWIGGVETVNVCEEEEVVGVDHGGGYGGEGVVISEFNFLCVGVRECEQYNIGRTMFDEGLGGDPWKESVVYK